MSRYVLVFLASSFFSLPHIQVASCPENTEAASLDVAKAYQISPISPDHKKYLCIFWKGAVYVQHVAIKGLATAGGIQGNIPDATLAILKYHEVEPAVKWVDNFVFFRVPVPTEHSCTSPLNFKFKLSTILEITSPLGIPWHPISKKGHDFKSLFAYIGFDWDIPSCTVSLSNEKCLHLLTKLNSI